MSGVVAVIDYGMGNLHSVASALEHVGAERGSWERRAQRALRPCWRFFADGCNLDRDLARNLEGAGFATLQLERFRARLPHVMGSARA